MVTVVLDRKFGLGKERLIELLSEQGIDCRPFFHPLSSLPAFQHDLEARRAQTHNRVAHAISFFGINLPSGFDLTPEKVHYVCNALKNALRSCSRSIPKMRVA